MHISREAQDAFALESHRRAVAAIDDGRFTSEIVAVDGLTTDEGPRRDTSAAQLARLRPAFHVSGTVTAGNSSQMSDGAAAVVVMSRERANAIGAQPLGRVVAHATAGVEPELFGRGPVPAIQKVLRLAGLTLDQIDLVELRSLCRRSRLPAELPIVGDST